MKNILNREFSFTELFTGRKFEEGGGIDEEQLPVPTEREMGIIESAILSIKEIIKKEDEESGIDHKDVTESSKVAKKIFDGFRNSMVNTFKDIDDILDKMYYDRTHYPLDANIPYMVTTYTHGRAYGGPEEGGWYYDEYDPHHHEEFNTYEDAKKYIEELGERMKKEHRKVYHGDGIEVAYLELVLGENQAPTTRPHYE